MTFQRTGEYPEWRRLLDALKGLTYGKLVTYDELDLILDRDFRGNRTPIYRCTRELEKSFSKTLISVTGEGYRIAQPSEHDQLGHHHVKKGTQQLKRAKSRWDSADRNALEPEVIARLDAQSATVADHAAKISRIEREQGRITRLMEQAQADQQAKDAQLVGDIAQIKATLRANGLEPPKEES